MASSPIRRESARRGVYYQVKWTYNGQPEQLEEDEYQAALAASNWITARHNQFKRTDPAIVGRRYLHPDADTAMIKPGAKTWREVCAEWLTTKTVAANTRRGILSKLTHFESWDDRWVGEINHHALNLRYRDLLAEVNKWTGKPIQRATAEGIMATCCEVLNYAHGEDYTPFSARSARAAKKFAFKAPSQNKSAARNAFTRPQVLAMLAALPTYQDRLMFRFLIATGARIGELMALNCEDLNLDRGLVTIGHHMVGTTRVVGTKGSRGAEPGPAYDVVLDAKLIKELRAFVAGRAGGEPLWVRSTSGRGRRAVSPYVPAGSWRSDVFNVAVARLMETGELGRSATPHWTRHTTGTWSRTLLPSRMLSDHMRHSDPRTTMIYEWKSDESIAVIRTALDEIFDDLGDEGGVHAA